MPLSVISVIKFFCSNIPVVGGTSFHPGYSCSDSRYVVLKPETSDIGRKLDGFYSHLCDVTRHDSIFIPGSKSTEVVISSAIWASNDGRLFYPPGLPVFRPHRTKCKHSVYLSFLLLIGNVDPNPGPVNNSRKQSKSYNRIKSKKQDYINFGFMNARSAARKAALIHDVIEEHHLDLVFVGETWIPSDAPDAIKVDIAPTGYRVMHAHRGTSGEKRGGGIAVIYRESIQLSIVDVGKYDEFESLSVRITSSSSSHTIVCIYDPRAMFQDPFVINLLIFWIVC